MLNTYNLDISGSWSGASNSIPGSESSRPSKLESSTGSSSGEAKNSFITARQACWSLGGGGGCKEGVHHNNSLSRCHGTCHTGIVYSSLWECYPSNYSLHDMNVIIPISSGNFQCYRKLVCTCSALHFLVNSVYVVLAQRHSGIINSFVSQQRRRSGSPKLVYR